MADLKVFISADWSKDPRKRSVHVADVEQRRIWREERGDPWDLKTILELAQDLTERGSVLVGLDLALGVPAGYWAEVLKVPCWRGSRSFLGWLRMLEPSSGFFGTARTAAEWQSGRPFFHVPRGEGGLRSITSLVEGSMRRRIDVRTGAKPMFAVSGIPGTVGSGTRDFWMELIPFLTDGRRFAVWPFEGELEGLLANRGIVLAETYPGLAYAAALAEALPTRRLVISKTKQEAREQACDLLQRARWHREAGVDLGDLGPARADEDAFDSHLTAAAVLRCAVEGLPLCDPAWIDREAEGAMLLAGPVDPARRASRLAPGATGKSGTAPREKRPKKLPSRRQRPGSGDVPERPDHRCPLPGCSKVFHGSRGGWDAHIGSLRMHQRWHSDVTDPEERRRLFKEEYGEWF